MEKSDEILRIKNVRNFDEQNFDELIVAFIGKVLTGKRLEGKTLTNCSPFVKFVRLFHRQSFALYIYILVLGDIKINLSVLVINILS